MVVVDASVLVTALLINGPARTRLAEANLQAPELIDAELLPALRRLVLAGRLPEQLGATLLTADARAARDPGHRCSVEVLHPWTSTSISFSKQRFARTSAASAAHYDTTMPSSWSTACRGWLVPTNSMRLMRPMATHDLAAVHDYLLPEAFGCRNWLTVRVSTVAELEEVLNRIDNHDGAAYVEVMIPNEERQPMPESTIDSGYKLKTPEVG